MTNETFYNGLTIKFTPAFKPSLNSDYICGKSCSLENAKGRILQVKESRITVITQNETDFISLTDMTAGFSEGSGLTGKWITNKNTLKYLGVWEKIKKPDFNYPEFGVIKNSAGSNNFT